MRQANASNCNEEFLVCRVAGFSIWPLSTASRWKTAIQPAAGVAGLRYNPATPQTAKDFNAPALSPGCDQEWVK
jgi:hypothetical protein